MENSITYALLQVLFALSLMIFQPAASSTNFTDQDALLHFKSAIEDDPTNTIKGSNWTTKESFCKWIGVTCSLRRQRVTVLDLSFMGLRGRLSPYTGNLSFLVSLDLRNNSFYGMIPPEISRLHRLEELILQSNMFDGSIPPSLARCQNLQAMSLAVNRLTGSIPQEFGTFPKLQELYLSFNAIGGEIPTFLGNISTLQVIGLVMANLTGSIPPGLFNLSLTSVMLTYNALSGALPSDLCYRWPNIQRLLLSDNRFSGPLPETLTQCKELAVLSLSFNKFKGTIPRDIDRLTKLQELYLGTNNLTGTIPSRVGNMSSLRMLFVEYNHIEGNIPSEIENLVNLNGMSLQNNLLSGEVPKEIFNISSLQSLSLMSNSLSGDLPSSSELSLPNLKALYIAENAFTGNIPPHFSNYSKLAILDAGNNLLNGPIPTSFSNLKNLMYFAVQSNQLTGGGDGNSELSFLSALSNCESLETLVLEENPLRGFIPESITNFSSSLQILFAPNCQISGRIPRAIGFLKELTFLQLSDNDLEGNIPSSIGGLENLQRLYLDNNNLEGSIPNEMCNLTNLGELLLRGNRISGPLPDCIGKLGNLQKLLVSSNNMTSVIPVSLWILQELLFLNLSLNSFEGVIPPDVGKMTAMQSIDLSWNKISGTIPSSIGELQSLSSLNLSRNCFQGSIPATFGDLKGLDFLDLSYNNLSGTIPNSMERLSYLKVLNLSFNKLSGEIPSGGPFTKFSALSFTGNQALCGNPIFQVPSCRVNGKKSSRSKRLRLLCILLPIISAIFIVFVIYLLKRSLKNSGKTPTSVESRETLPGIDHRPVSYQELCSATDNFCESNLLGVGSFGRVYKGTLSDGTDVAVKVLNLQIEGAFKSFDAECEVLRKIRHRNLVKVVSVCTNADMRVLVLQYIPNGSLERWLYSYNYSLSLNQRVNIMVDVASAIEYLHHGQPEPVVHCDLKPSNVLPNEDMVAQVCDFGIAKILAENKIMTQTRTLGTIGYVAPEYGSEGRVSTKGDVYSYGIMLLEVITRKKPTDEMFAGGTSLRQWVDDAVPDRILGVLDDGLRDSTSIERILLPLVELGLECSKDLPDERTDMRAALVKINKIKLLLP